MSGRVWHANASGHKFYRVCMLFFFTENIEDLTIYHQPKRNRTMRMDGGRRRISERERKGEREGTRRDFQTHEWNKFSFKRVMEHVASIPRKHHNLFFLSQICYACKFKKSRREGFPFSWWDSTRQVETATQLSEFGFFFFSTEWLHVQGVLINQSKLLLAKCFN